MTDQRLALVCLVILAAVATGFALHWLRPVMIPFIFAGVLALAVRPIAGWLSQTLKVPHALAMFLALAGSGGLFVALGSLVGHSAQTFAGNAEQYAGRLDQLMGQVEAWAKGHGMDLGRAGLSADQATGYAQQLAKGALNVFSNAFLVLICLMFLLQGKPAPLRAGGFREKVTGRVRRYLVIKVGTSAVTGVAVGLILYFVGLDLALTFGVLTFLLNFIPSVGSVIAMLLPAPLVVLDPQATWVSYALVFGLPATVHGVVGNVIEPRLMGESLELHPVTVLLGLIFWGMLWGVPGMFLAAPLTAVIKIVLEQHEVTAPFGRLLGGQVGEAEAA